jgi:hypothetical protein
MDAEHFIFPVATGFALTESEASCKKFFHHLFVGAGLAPALHGYVCIVDRSQALINAAECFFGTEFVRNCRR